MEFQKGFTQGEWDQLLRLSESDPKEAVRRLLGGISDPFQRKTRYQDFKLDSREYNLGVKLWEDGYRTQAMDYFEGLMVEHAREVDGIFHLVVMGYRRKKVKVRPKVNLYVRLWNTGVNPLNPVSVNDRLPGVDNLIMPGDTFEGFVYFPNLCAWTKGGKIATLVGV